jgi:hypothetical protein
MTDEQRTGRDPGAGQQGKQEHRGGMPGDGVGRREEPGETGVHPFSDARPDMPMRTPGEWGRSDDEQGGGSETSFDEASRPPPGTVGGGRPAPGTVGGGPEAARTGDPQASSEVGEAANLDVDIQRQFGESGKGGAGPTRSPDGPRG